MLEHRQKPVVEAVAVRCKRRRQAHLLAAVSVGHVYPVAVAEAFVAHLHAVLARVAHHVLGLRAPVLPAVIRSRRVGRQPKLRARAKRCVIAQFYVKVLQVLHRYGVAHARAVVGDHHPVGAVVDDRVCSVGGAVLPEVGGRVGLSRVQQQRHGAAQGGVGAEVHGAGGEEVHEHAVGVCRASPVCDGHGVEARRVDGDGGRCCARAPLVEDGVGVLGGELRAAAQDGVGREADDRRGEHLHEGGGGVGAVGVAVEDEASHVAARVHQGQIHHGHVRIVRAVKGPEAGDGVPLRVGVEVEGVAHASPHSGRVVGREVGVREVKMFISIAGRRNKK